MTRTAIVVGAGPNGLAAAARLAEHGVQVTVYEQAGKVGGAARSADTLGPGTTVDLGAAAHPFGVGSPAFLHLGLERHGLRWLRHRYPMAHPLDNGRSAVLHPDLETTAAELGVDAAAWRTLHRAVAGHPLESLENATGPLLRIPPHPLLMAGFGARALWPADGLARLAFRTEAARALFAGSAAHSMLPLNHVFTSGFAVLFGGLGQSLGWPVARGGTNAIIHALVQQLALDNVVIHTNSPVGDLRELPASDAVLLDLTPRQVLELAGTGIGGRYASHLRRWKYGPGAFKVDYLLDGPVPWRDERTSHAGTVHVGGSLADVIQAERDVGRGKVPARPFVMLAQPSAADESRAPAGQQVIWSYAHVPNGCDADVGPLVDRQIERFAPGFGDRVIGRVETPPRALEDWNPNLVGGDIGGGSLRGTQQVLRPAPTLRPYHTGAPGLYICSSSTPPGGGVHGMAGWHAADAVLRDLGIG
ncbi:phytoene desaturase family protein [Paeniglutamicibacter sulfureus]|uniref:Phytoene dehydrogenase-like protein n=1 Tax=Paeniglutamicibacter sulfureus TaxID=43666 RepID=A0ABU2BNW5_9MICC|nr:NAD(P)/FAD-dependent oxidoreductase [Paeniglutamicibacter sulfureus]MDR7360352.1 phytoene dehydrogenase-like protein [Paeniglutamicibacter sulfureus]